MSESRDVRTPRTRSYTDFQNLDAPKLPVRLETTGLDRAGNFAIRGIRTFFTPMRAFASTKAVLFAALAATLLAGKAAISYSTELVVANLALSEPTLGQTILLVFLVVALAFFNLRALRMTSRARAKADDALLRFMSSSEVSEDLKREVLSRLRD